MLCVACWFMFAISLITDDNILMSWPTVRHLSDIDDKNPCVTHSATQGYYAFFRWHFEPFPGHDLPCFLPPVTSTSCRCVPVFSYRAIWRHHSTLCLSICSSAFQQAYFLRDFIPEFDLGFCFSTPLLHAQPNVVFQPAYTSHMSLYHPYSSSLHRRFQTPLSCTGTNILRVIYLSKNPII
jgi:hypothetical protein